MVLIRVLTIAALVLTIGACTTSSPGRAAGSTPQSGFQANTQPIAQRLAGDFPIPLGVKIDPEDSLVLGSGSTWTGRIIFATDSSANDAFIFYRDQPKSSGWSLVTSLFSKASVLTFTKGGRSATIQITSSMFGSTQVSIVVGPLPGN